MRTDWWQMKPDMLKYQGLWDLWFIQQCGKKLLWKLQIALNDFPRGLSFLHANWRSGSTGEWQGGRSCVKNPSRWRGDICVLQITLSLPGFHMVSFRLWQAFHGNRLRWTELHDPWDALRLIFRSARQVELAPRAVAKSKGKSGVQLFHMRMRFRDGAGPQGGIRVHDFRHGFLIPQLEPHGGYP